MKKKVSIIIPCYNIEKFVSKCLDSVICQTYSNLEILLINDGSTDKTNDICKIYEENDSRIQLINKVNGGLSSARNEGLKYITGEYCYFLDGDDFLNENAIEVLVDTLEKNNSDISVASTQCCNEFGEVYPTEPIDKNIYIINSDEDRYDFYAQIYYNYKIRFEVWNKLFKTSIIKDNSIFFEDNYKIFAEDVCFISYYLLHVKSISATNIVIHNYLIRSDSITGSLNGNIKLNNIISLINKLQIYIEKNYLDGYFKMNFPKLYILLIHDRIKWIPIYKLKKSLRSISPENITILNSIPHHIIKDKKNFMEYFNTFKPLNRKLGTALLEEALLLKYNTSTIIYYLYMSKIITSRFFRKIKRTIKKRD